jgi:hypothetical protein
MPMQAESLEVLEIEGAKDTLATKNDVGMLRQELNVLRAELRGEMKELRADLRTETSRAASDGLRQMYMALLAHAIVMFAFVCFVAALRP